MKIKLIKFREDLIAPVRAHYNDAGIDCFAQEDFELTFFAPGGEVFYNGCVCKSHDRMLVPLGFGLEIPDGYMAVIKPRSSMNVKGIITQIGTIDSGYRGELKAYLINTSNEFYSFKRGDKICQIVIEPVVVADLVDELGDERGTGGFGSSGR